MNCIWITVDSLRQDHVHCYFPEGSSDPEGEEMQVQTPNIDRLASEGVLFERMRAETLPTISARRSMFTGRRLFPWPDEPFYKGIYLHTPGWRPLPQEDVTLAEHLSEQEWVTAMVSDVYHLMKPSMNFHRGFQGYHWVRGQEYDLWKTQPLPPGHLEQFLKPGTTTKAPASGWIPSYAGRFAPGEYRERKREILEQYLRNQMFRQGDDDFQAARTFRRAIEWLEQNHKHEQFYLYVDSFDPHEPFESPQRFLDLYEPEYEGPQLIYGNLYNRAELTDREHHHIRARYAAEVTMVDHWVGRLLETVERLGLRENTLIVFLSDHGKILGEFGAYGMSAECTGLALSPVPCILRHPKGENANQRFTGWLYNIDITATVLNLLGVDPKPGNEGESVWQAVSSSAGQFREHLVCAHGSIVSVWEGDWLYLLDTTTIGTTLYNLADDPSRSTDVSGDNLSVRDNLADKLRAVAEGKGKST